MSQAALQTETLAEQVRRYLSLTPRQLPSSALYDALGSILFDAICLLPWYPLTRAGRRLIAEHRLDMLDAAGQPSRLVELGCGNGQKMDLLLGDGPPPVERVDLIDVSALALAEAVRTVGEGRTVTIHAHHERYEEGLTLALADRTPDDRVCVLFLGSNIGNFDPEAAQGFLASIRAALRPGDALLMGVDLVKPVEVLLLAYDDPLGVTAAFNKNLLVRLNAELGADFDLDAFEHHAVWNAEASRVEMHLVSRRAQAVRIPGAGIEISLAERDTIWTESSYKFDEPGVDDLVRGAGFTPARRWIDHDSRFLLTVALAG